MSKEAIIRLKDARKNHNEDCLFCALKDTRINEALKFLESEPEPTELERQIYELVAANTNLQNELKAADKQIKAKDEALRKHGKQGVTDGEIQ
jgi:transposase